MNVVTGNIKLVRHKLHSTFHTEQFINLIVEKRVQSSPKDVNVSERHRHEAMNVYLRHYIRICRNYVVVMFALYGFRCFYDGNTIVFNEATHVLRNYRAALLI